MRCLRAREGPWDTWAGTLNLFVWLVVGIYLVWGCRARYRPLGLTISRGLGLPFASWLAGAGVARGVASAPFLVFHVGLVLAGLAGFTLAAAMSGPTFRRAKAQAAALPRHRTHPSVTLDALLRVRCSWRCPRYMRVGLGLVRLRDSGGGFDALMGASLLTVAVYATYLLLRFEAGWRGRRAAYVALAGFAVVIVVRLALPLAHFA